MSSVLCGKPTPGGAPCRRPVKTPGAPCGAAHPDPAAVVSVGTGAAGTGPGPDPLGPVEETFDLVDPRDGSVPVEAMTDSQLAYAAGLAGVAPGGPGGRAWLKERVAEWVSSCPPPHWKMMRMGWSWSDGRDGGAGEWDFAVDPAVHHDDESAKTALVAALVESVIPDGDDLSEEPPDVPYPLCWGDLGEWLDRDVARSRGVMAIDRPGIEPSGGNLVCGPVGHDDTIFDPDDVRWSLSAHGLDRELAEAAARWDPGCAVDYVKDLTDPADLGRWASHWAADPRAAVAGHPDCPPGVLERLASDPDPLVRAAAAANRNCPPAARAHAGLLAD